MKKAKAGSKRASGAVDFETVRELARIAAEFDLAEVEAEPSGRVRIRRGVAGAPVASPFDPATPARPTGTIALLPSAAAETGVVISSPFVGTFYRAASPETAQFVELGQMVRKGQVVCIVEAMKLMNEIESESDGKVVEILVKNGDHVEYGQAMFRLSQG